MTDIIDASQSTNQTTDTNAPVPPPPPTEPPPEPPSAPISDMPTPPAPPSDNLVVPPPEVKTEPEKPIENSESTIQDIKPKKNKLKPGVIIAVILLLLVTVPLTVFYVSQSKQLGDIRSQAKKNERYGLNTNKYRNNLERALLRDGIYIDGEHVDCSGGAGGTKCGDLPFIDPKGGKDILSQAIKQETEKFNGTKTTQAPSPAANTVSIGSSFTASECGGRGGSIVGGLCMVPVTPKTVSIGSSFTSNECRGRGGSIVGGQCMVPVTVVFPSAKIPGISTTGTANTQTTTYTGDRVCDVMTNCNSSIKSVTVTENYANRTMTYSVNYIDTSGNATKTVITTYEVKDLMNHTLGDIVKQETLQGGSTKITFDGSLINTKCRVGGPAGRSGAEPGSGCGSGTTCNANGFHSDGVCVKSVNTDTSEFVAPNYTTLVGGTGGGTGGTDNIVLPEVDMSGDGGGGDGGGGNDGGSPPPQCINLVAYKDGDALNDAELAALKVGDVITLALSPGGAATKVRFRVNSTSDADWHESTTKNANSQFVWDYTLTNATSFTVKAQWFDGTSWH